MKRIVLIGLLLILSTLVACSQESEPAPATPTGEPPTNAPMAETVTPTDIPATPTASPAVDDANEQPPGSPSPTPTPTTAPELTPAPTEPQASGDPIQITYFTPSQGEGPYYPVDKLNDQDNDLTSLQGANGIPAGQIVEFGGVVYDANGMPQPGIVVEIWQTDASGVYLHPGDPGTDQRDPNFQFYGESVTTADGRYDFRTILPGRYEPRPRHIHVKVKLNDQELLTTQFYFADDPELAGEAMLAQVGQDGEHLIITLEETQDEDGQPILIGQRDIVLNLDLSN